MTAEAPSIRAWMSSPVCTVQGSATCEACSELMARYQHHHLPVVDAEGHVGGMITDQALLALEMVFRPQRDPGAPREAPRRRARAEDLALPLDILVAPETAASDVLGALRRSAQDAAIVVDPTGRPIGIFTEHDVVRLAAEHLADRPTTRDLPRRSVVSIGPSRPLRLARVLMQASQGRHLLVVREGVVVGVLSRRDLSRSGPLRAFDDLVLGLDRPVGRLVRREVRSIGSGASLRQAAASMAEHQLGCLPVVDDEGRPVNVVTRTDLIGPLAVVLG